MIYTFIPHHYQLGNITWNFSIWRLYLLIPNFKYPFVFFSVNFFFFFWVRLLMRSFFFLHVDFHCIIIMKQLEYEWIIVFSVEYQKHINATLPEEKSYHQLDVYEKVAKELIVDSVAACPLSIISILKGAWTTIPFIVLFIEYQWFFY